VIVPNKSTLYIDHDSLTNRLRDIHGSETDGTNVIHLWGGGYDAAGDQQMANGTPSYNYDTMNMMSELTAPRHEFYIYDADDERVATVGYTDSQNSVPRYTLRDATNHVLRTVTDTILAGAHSWQQTEDYVYRTGGLLAAITPQGSTESRKHFHLDHLSSPVLVTDDNGHRLSSHKYWPFGTDAPGNDTDGERMKFTGHERDVGPFGANGLDYMHARYYDASLGRFLSVDPYLADDTLRDPEKWNRYGYAGNTPIKYVDPNGKDTLAVFLTGDERYRKVSTWNVIVSPQTIADVKHAWNDYVSEPLGKAEAYRYAGILTASGAASIGARLLAWAGIGTGVTAVTVSQGNLSMIEDHLASLAPSGANDAMLGRLQSALDSGQTLTGADLNFYLHEVAEANLVRQGVGQEMAHQMVLEQQGVSPYSLYVSGSHKGSLRGVQQKLAAVLGR
jgi:RHS repeat-associated protein